MCWMISSCFSQPTEGYEGDNDRFDRWRLIVSGHFECHITGMSSLHVLSSISIMNTPFESRVDKQIS